MFRLCFINNLRQKLPNSLQIVNNRFTQTTCCQVRYVSSVKLAKNQAEKDAYPNLRKTQIENDKEKDFLVRLKNDPDVFGDPPIEQPIDEDDLAEEKYFEDQPPPGRKLSTKKYADKIKDLIKKRKIKEAIDFVEIKMLKEDRAKPENYIYNLLLGACGRVGYTKKAFMLYNQMKKRGLKVHPGAYTALFNACANSPWPEDGLSRANHLRSIMLEKGYKPNDTNYNAMIKAYGRCGDSSTAFSLVDEMLSKKLRIKDDTINFLLQACISDSEAGFRHALLVWRKLIHKKIQPSLFTFNLMLRGIRDCGLGDLETTKEVIDKILLERAKQNRTDQAKLIESGQSDQELVLLPASDNRSEVNQNGDHNELVAVDDHFRPNLMAKVPHLGNVISLSEVKKPEDRLLLVGGMKGFLKNMEDFQCKPDIKTFTQLLDCLPGNLASENELLNFMKKLEVKPDLDFYNMLIKKRSIRCDYQSAKDVLVMIKKGRFRFKPNLFTYGILALGCETKEDAFELITEMKSQHYGLNTEILGTFLHQACHHKNFPYVLEMMELTIKEEIKPNKIFMERLIEFKKECKAISNDDENKLGQTKAFQKGYKIFKLRYKSWIPEVEVEESENQHPWTQFRQTSETDVGKYKDTDVRFKPRRASHFKVKTSSKIRY